MQHQPAAALPFYAAFQAQRVSANGSNQPLTLTLRQQLTQADSATQPTLLTQHLERTIATVLGLAQARQFDPHLGFAQMGFDSLMGIELRNQLAKSLDQRLPATLIFDYPTLTKLQEFLLAELSSAQGDAPLHTAEAVPTVEGLNGRPHVAIEALSDEELIAQIDAEFLTRR